MSHLAAQETEAQKAQKSPMTCSGSHSCQIAEPGQAAGLPACRGKSGVPLRPGDAHSLESVYSGLGVMVVVVVSDDAEKRPHTPLKG